MKTRRQNYSDDLPTVNRQIKQVKTSEKEGENALPIPIDLVFEIFSRLPMKCIARCRCVSKIWASMLKHREFTELFKRKSYARPQLLFACHYGSKLLLYSSPQPQDPDENSPPIIANYQTSFSFDGRCTISGVVNGLICVIKYKLLVNGMKEKIPVICKPSTGQSLHLKKVKTSRVVVRSMFGYDPIDKEFKVLSMTWGPSGVDEEHQVQTIGTDKWRMVECCIPGQHRYTNKEICINGVIYYQSICSTMDINAICCFDIRSEKLSFIKLNGVITYPTLINYGGNLGLLWSGIGDDRISQNFGQRSTSLKLWVLEDVERQEWSKRNLVLPPMWKQVVGKHTLSVVGVTRTNEIVFESLFRSCPLYLFYLNIDKNTIVRIEIQGMDHGVCVFMNHVEDVKLI